MKRFFHAALFLAASFPCFAETEIEIRGMKSMGTGEVLQLMGGRLEYIRSKPANPWRADDAAFLIARVLRKNGYEEVVVNARVEGADRILLLVVEGPRIGLGKVTVLGDKDAENLAKLFSLPARKDMGFGIGSPPFREEDVATGLQYVEQELNARGYWDAKVELKAREKDTQAGLVDITLAVDRGERFKIARPEVRSPDGRGLELAAEAWGPFVGKRADTKNINALRAAMGEAFTSRGYPDAEITMGRRLAGATYIPEFGISLGVRVKLREIHAEGLERTDGKRLARIMGPLEGDWYDEAAMNAKVRRLLATGAFNSIRIGTQAVADGRIDATLHIEEARAKEISLAAGAGSFNGPMLRAAYTDRNFQGKLRGFSAGLEISGRGALGEVKLTDPWWLGTDITATQRWFSRINGYDGYTSIESGIDASWSWDAGEHHAMELLLGYSFVTVSENGLPTAFLGETNYGHLRAAFTQKWDYRDNPALPKSGWHLSVPLRVGATIGDSSAMYWKAGLDGGWYRRLGADWQLGVGGFAEFVSPSGDLADLPVDLRVFNGGARSVRSFPERELGPAFGGDPYGGDFSWAVNTEISRSITDSVAAVAFVDAGAVTGNYTGGRQGGLELAAGLGIRFDLPIGPVRLEYGHNLTRDGAEPEGTFHFAIGATF